MTPSSSSKPVKRLAALAHELAVEGPTSRRRQEGARRAAQGPRRSPGPHATEIAAARSSVLTVEGKTVVAHLHAKESTFDQFVAVADQVVIDDAYRRAARALSPDVVRTYAEHLAEANTEATEPDEVLVQSRV